jgi:hypothetical protein
VCVHDRRDEIDRELAKPNRVFSAIAAKYGISPDSVERHAKNHLAPGLSEALADYSELAVDVAAESERLYRRMEALLTKLETTDNWQAIKGIGQECRSTLELLSKQQQLISDAPQLHLHLNPEWLELRATIVGALERHPDALSDLTAALESKESGVKELEAARW